MRGAEETDVVSGFVSPRKAVWGCAQTPAEHRLLQEETEEDSTHSVRG